MSITYKIDSFRDVIVEEWHGSVEVEDVAALRDCQMNFSGDELRCKIRTVLFPSMGARRIKTAILVNGPLQYGVARQFLAYSDEIGNGQVFTNEVAACQWLLE